MTDELPDPVGHDQIEAFDRDLTALINRYIEEYDLPIATMVGVLHCKIHEILEENKDE